MLNCRQLLQSESALNAIAARLPNRADLNTAYIWGIAKLLKANLAAGLTKFLWNFSVVCLNAPFIKAIMRIAGFPRFPGHFSMLFYRNRISLRTTIFA